MAHRPANLRVGLKNASRSSPSERTTWREAERANGPLRGERSSLYTARLNTEERAAFF